MLQTVIVTLSFVFKVDYLYQISTRSPVKRDTHIIVQSMCGNGLTLFEDKYLRMSLNNSLYDVNQCIL